MARYHMNRREKEITDAAEIRSILRFGRYATIAMCRGSEPYVLTMNYGLDPENDTLFFHSASKGLKLEFLKENPKVCATVIQDLGYSKGECEHKFRSAVFWGMLKEIQVLSEKRSAMDVLLAHQEDDPDSFRKRLLPEDESYGGFSMLKLEIEEITAKQSS
jgi:nitroimidazol reductase NimA-like FMN-containing flavoprotein (pyridoxamine 5'-phosphate oxidase superfamily)